MSHQFEANTFFSVGCNCPACLKCQKKTLTVDILRHFISNLQVLFQLKRNISHQTEQPPPARRRFSSFTPRKTTTTKNKKQKKKTCRGRTVRAGGRFADSQLLDRAGLHTSVVCLCTTEAVKNHPRKKKKKNDVRAEPLFFFFPFFFFFFSESGQLK